MKSAILFQTLAWSIIRTCALCVWSKKDFYISLRCPGEPHLFLPTLVPRPWLNGWTYRTLHPRILTLSSPYSSHQERSYTSNRSIPRIRYAQSTRVKRNLRKRPSQLWFCSMQVIRPGAFANVYCNTAATMYLQRCAHTEWCYVHVRTKSMNQYMVRQWMYYYSRGRYPNYINQRRM